MAKKSRAITRARPQATPHLHFIRDATRGVVRVWFSGDPGDVWQEMSEAEFDASWKWATERYPLLFVAGAPDGEDGEVLCAICGGAK